MSYQTEELDLAAYTVVAIARAHLADELPRESLVGAVARYDRAWEKMLGTPIAAVHGDGAACCEEFCVNSEHYESAKVAHPSNGGAAAA